MKKRKTDFNELTRFDVDPSKGLNKAQVEQRKGEGAVNVASGNLEKSYGRIIAENAFTFFNCVLYAIAIMFLVLIIYLGNTAPDVVAQLNLGATKFIFLLAVVMNVVIGSVQGIRSKLTLKKLRIVTEAKALAIREGQKTAIPAKDVVIDDVLLLSAGDQIPVDMTVLEGEVSVDESLLTGEADLVKKKAGDPLYSGSVVFVGSCRAKTDKVGDDTYASELSNKVKSLQNHKSELMVSIYRIINVLSVLLFVIVAVVVGTLIYKVHRWGPDILPPGEDLSKFSTWARIMVTTSSFAIGVIPTGLVLITSVTLAVSIVNLSKQQTLIQELYSLENLSRVNVICLDKTGTLTDGTMKVVSTLFLIPQDEFEAILKGILGCFETSNMTSKAMEEHFGRIDVGEKKEVIPFSSATKCSGYVSKDGHKFLMGAPDYIAKGNKKALDYAQAQGEKGNRVIAVTRDGEVIGLVALEDGIRASAKDTLQFFYENGVDVRIISGDNPVTVSRIAAMAGVQGADKAVSLEGVPLEEIPNIVSDYVVFARVSPEQKQAIVEALQGLGKKVAMTGDGVNDILALRKANASITFNNATDAAKSCSDVVLLDNDFSHLKAVVGEGRRVVNNIERTAVFFLMKTIAVAGLAFALIPFKEGQLSYTLENVYLLETAIIGTGGFLLSLEPTKAPIRGKFMRNVLIKAVPSGFLVWLAALLPVFLEKGGLIDHNTMKSLISCMTAIGGYTVLVCMCIPVHRFRAVCLNLVFGNVLLFALAIPDTFIGASSLSFNAETIPVLLSRCFQPWNSPAVRVLFVNADGGPNWPAIITMVGFLAVMIPGYYFVLRGVNKWLEQRNAKDEEKEIQALKK
ncbi:MAG: HAD-IC family P-type ATPase [Bacilli bacterium]|nr:HAD-IC family P-type ATPase [Bacilli bacterium]